VVQRQPEPPRPAVTPRTPPPAPSDAKPAPAQSEASAPAAPAARRRRPRFEEVSTPASDEAAVQRSPEPETPPAPAPTPATEEGGPLRWDHLGDLPPSMQRQLERVQRRLAEQNGLSAPGSADSEAQESERPFHPRNPNPVPARLAEQLPARVEQPGTEPDAPISFGPDLEPLRPSVQRQAQVPPAPASTETTAAEPSPTAAQPEAMPERPAEPEPLERQLPPEPFELEQAPVVTPYVARSTSATPPGSQDMPLVTPPEPEPVDDLAGEPPQLTAPVAAPEATIQRTPEVETAPAQIEASEAERLLPELTLRESPPTPEAPPAVQREAARPESAEQPAAARASEPATPAAPVTTPPAAGQSREEPQAERAETPPPAVSRAEQPLVLRQAAPPADQPAPAAPTRPPSAAQPSEATPPTSAATAQARRKAPQAAPPKGPATSVPPATLVQRSTQPSAPTEEPLVLRQPPAVPEAPAAAEPSRTTSEPARVQPAEERAAEAPAAVLPATETEPAASTEPPAEIETTTAADSGPLVAEIQRSTDLAALEPLVLREPPAASAPEVPEPETQAGIEVEPTGPDSDLGMAGPQGMQRQPAPEAELPLRTPAQAAQPASPVTAPAEAAPKAEAASPSTPAAHAPIQRQPQLNVPEQSLPLRGQGDSSPAAPAGAPAPAGVQPAAIHPTATAPSGPTAIQRQAETAGPDAPRLAMPLRQPAAPEPGAAGAGVAQAIAEAPGLSLGSQIYARGIKDARMTLVGPLATNVQRRPAAPGASAGSQVQTPAGPLPLMGLARSAAARTSVLPQARVQREQDERPGPQNQLVPYAPPRTEPSGTLPLAPPGPAPINPNPSQPPQTPPTPPPTSSPRPSVTSQALTLAPVIARDGGENGSTSDSPSTAGDEIDRDLNDLLAGLEDDSLFDDVTDDDEIDLDVLAEQILPIIRRLLTIERERNQPT
jgi:hypothetical protein